MPKLGCVSVFYWNANHIALELKLQKYDVETGCYAVDENNEPVVDKTFRALTHDSDPQDAFTSSLIPLAFKKILNDLFDVKR